MWMVAADRRSHRATGEVGWLRLWVGDHLALSLHSSDKLGELWQWSHHVLTYI